MKNIAFLISNLSNSGGTQRMLSVLCNELAEQYAITIFVNSGGPPFFMLKKEIKIEYLNEKKNIIDRNIYIYKYFCRVDCAYFINLDSNTALFNGFLLPKNTKLIIWEHFSITSNYKKNIFKLSRLYSVFRSYKFVLLSKYETEQWQKKYGLRNEKICLIYNPISIEKSLIYNKNNFEKKTFLAIGNNVVVKGFDILLDAWAMLDTDWKLKIVGLSSEETKMLHKHITKGDIKNVFIFEKTNDISLYYKEASAFVLSSRKEATPLVLIESQLFGLPAIVFDHLTSAFELLDDSHLIANFANPVVSLKNQMMQLINDKSLYDVLSSKAIINSTRFCLQSFVEQWQKILK